MTTHALSPLIVVGASGHGQVLAEAFRSQGGVLVGFVDDSLAFGATVAGFPVLGDCGELPRLLLENPGCGIAFGIGDNTARKRCVDKVRALCPTARFPVIIHASASVSESASIGEGTAILAGAVVVTGATVGEFAIINTRASLDHHSGLGAFASLAPAATVGGGAIIGAGAALGMGACVMQGRSVGVDTVVGAMALVYHDLPDRVVALGVPAEVRSERDFSKPYLTSPKRGA